MHNPLKLLFKEALDELIHQGYTYFVRQSYPRGKTASIKEAFLITPYNTSEEAAKHLDAIKTDHRKLIYNIQDQQQKENLYKAAAQPEGYLIYLNRLKDQEWQPTPQLTASIKKYIGRYTNWQLRKGTKINVALSLQFGELMITLQNRTDEIQVSLTDIEKI